MFLSLNQPQNAVPQLVGTINDNTTTEFQDTNYGFPNPPSSVPNVESWTRNGQGGGFVSGNKVRYAVTYTNSVGESRLGPWTEWLPIGEVSGPALVLVPTDATPYAECPTTGRNIYRMFMLRLDNEWLGTKAEKVGSIPDNITTTYTDLDWGSPMPPAIPPSLPSSTPWAQRTPSGGWVSGNQVFYAVSFVNAQGQESPIGPWSTPVTVGEYALPLLQGVPLDTSTVDPTSATVRRNIYRCFSIGTGDAVVVTPAVCVGQLDDNTTTQWQDNSYGASNPPTSSPVISSWWDVPNGGSFVAGNQVSYALSFIAADGSESALGPWSGWTPIGTNAGPQFDSLEIDPTNYLHNPTTHKRLYRRFKLQVGSGVVITPMQSVLTLDVYTPNATDEDLGAPMPPITPPGPIQAGSEPAPAGAFEVGSQVSYAVSYVNASGEESLPGPWSPWTTITAGNSVLPLVTNLPTDGSLISGTTARNVYRIIDPGTPVSSAAAEARSLPEGPGPQGTLTLSYIRCVQPSSGLPSDFDTWMQGTVAAAGVIVSVGGVIAAASAPTGGGPVVGGVIAAVGGLVIAVAGVTELVANAVGSSSPDQLYLAIDGTRVWPTPTSTYDIKKGQQVELPPLTYNFSGTKVHVQLYEADTSSSDDILVDITVDIGAMDVGSVVTQADVPIANEDEHSIYILGLSWKRTA